LSSLRHSEVSVYQRQTALAGMGQARPCCQPNVTCAGPRVARPGPAPVGPLRCDAVSVRTAAVACCWVAASAAVGASPSAPWPHTICSCWPLVTSTWGEALVFDWPPWRSAARSPARSACAPPPSRRRNALRSMCRLAVGMVGWCSPTGVPTRCWSGATSRSTADAAWACACSPPRCHPTWGCAPRSGAKVTMDPVTAGRGFGRW